MCAAETHSPHLRVPSPLEGKIRENVSCQDFLLLVSCSPQKNLLGNNVSQRFKGFICHHSWCVTELLGGPSLIFSRACPV